MTTTPRAERCKVCRFRQAETNMLLTKTYSGTCRQMPPLVWFVSDGAMGYFGRFPPVNDDDWCKSFEPIRESDAGEAPGATGDSAPPASGTISPDVLKVATALCVLDWGVEREPSIIDQYVPRAQAAIAAMATADMGTASLAYVEQLEADLAATLDRAAQADGRDRRGLHDD